MHADMDRRAFLTAIAALTAGAWLPRWSAAQGGKTRLILLGTGGGPRPKTVNMSSAQVIIVKDALYVVDCGDGVARRLVIASQSLQKLRHVFITHHHSDHNADYGNLFLLSWASDFRTRVDTCGGHRRSRESQALPRDERVRHRHPHSRRGARAPGATHSRALRRLNPLVEIGPVAPVRDGIGILNFPAGSDAVMTPPMPTAGAIRRRTDSPGSVPGHLSICATGTSFAG